MTAYIGEIRLFAGNFAPVGWAFCDGRPLPISENDALFVLIGTMYGGDGQETFNLPDLRGRVPRHFGNGPDGVPVQMAEAAGVEQVTLTTQQIPNHTHALVASTDQASQQSPANRLLAQSTVADMYIQDSPDGTLAPVTVSPVGGSQPHDNMQPYLVVNFIISLFGVFPQQN